MNECEMHDICEGILKEFFYLVPEFNDPNQFSKRGVMTVTPNNEKYPQLKPNDLYQFVCVDRNIENLMDYCKVADFVFCIHSLDKINMYNLNNVPEDSLNVIDEIGNSAISSLRAQGQLPTFSLFLNMPKLQAKKVTNIKFYCKRLIKEEFNSELSYFIDSNTDIIKLLIELQNSKRPNLEWRANRGYLLVDKIIQKSAGLLLVNGYLKGNCRVDNNFHITGIGNFASSSSRMQFWTKQNPIDMTSNPSQFDSNVRYNEESKVNQIEEENEEFEVESNDEDKDDFAKINDEINNLTLLTTEC